MLLTTKTTVDSPMTEGDEKLSPSHCLLSLFLPLSPARVDWGPRSSRHSTRRPPPLGLRYFLQGQHQPDPEPVKLSVKPIVGDNKSPLPRSYYDWLKPSSSISDLLFHSDSESIEYYEILLIKSGQWLLYSLVRISRRKMACITELTPIVS